MIFWFWFVSIIVSGWVMYFIGYSEGRKEELKLWLKSGKSRTS